MRADGNHETSAFGQLRDQHTWNLWRTGRNDDRIIWRMLAPARRPITARHFHIVAVQPLQIAPRAPGKLGTNLDAKHARAQMRQYRCL